ncbi:uncharacterized protein LOC106647235 [Copidosoma floridanum]|uniref:uncharacterized protein LOC106647235 n=1 Tax=Copidosoma floridanum TaxID=29053 RepID=UPI0006C9469A|nr:uncharacterized protein LOC106647235 [Copidosoma floridanum]
MEALTSAQYATYNKMRNSYANFKKLGQAKMTCEQATARLKQLDNTFSEFQSTHSLIWSQDPPIAKDHPYLKDDVYPRREEQYYLNLGDFTDFIDSIRVNIGSHDSPRGSDPVSSYSSLPRVDLPRFSRSREDWPHIRAVFKALVHNKAEIFLAIKHHFLQTQVKGEAADWMKNIPLTSENYNQAWTTVVDYYDNKRRLVSSYVNSTLNAPSMKNSSSVELKQLISQTLRPLATLDNLDRAEHSLGDLFIGIVSS